MREQVSRTVRGSISVLLFGALAAGGVSFGYLAATSGDAASLTRRADAQKASANQREAARSVLARVDPGSR
jgi:hypothetical protein